MFYRMTDWRRIATHYYRLRELIVSLRPCHNRLFLA